MTIEMPEEDWRQLREPDQEKYLVDVIKRRLRTPEQKRALDDHDISIEDMLNGRVEGAVGQVLVERIFADWNDRLGERMFGA